MLLRISLFAALLLSCFCFTSALLMSVNKPRTMKASWKALKMSTVEEDDDFEGSALIGAAGVAANIFCDYSLYVLKTTGCGLPAGPFGLEGAGEGISYLGIVGLFGWSLFKKVKTGSGLPAGKYNLLGLAEGLTFLTVIAGIAIGVFTQLDYGSLPGFLPNDRCLGI